MVPVPFSQIDSDMEAPLTVKPKILTQSHMEVKWRSLPQAAAILKGFGCSAADRIGL